MWWLLLLWQYRHTPVSAVAVGRYKVASWSVVSCVRGSGVKGGGWAGCGAGCGGGN